MFVSLLLISVGDRSDILLLLFFAFVTIQGTVVIFCEKRIRFSSDAILLSFILSITSVLNDNKVRQECGMIIGNNNGCLVLFTDSKDNGN